MYRGTLFKIVGSIKKSLGGSMSLTRIQKNYLLGVMLIIFMSFIISGCSKDSSVEETEIIPNEGDVIQSGKINLNEYMHYDLNQTLYYNGEPSLNRYESCVRIDEIISPNIGKLYFFEGELENTLNTLEDTSFYKAYKLTDAYLALYYDDQNEMILLKNDISEGSTWKTSMIEPDLGLLEIQASVEKVDHDEITVTYKCMDNQNIPAEQQYVLEYVFKPGQGIIKERHLYKDSELELNLTQKSSDTPSTFVSRYNKPSELISKLYSDTYFLDLITDAAFKQKTRMESLDDNDLYKSYKTYLNQLDAERMGSIRRAKEMLGYFTQYTEKPLRLVRQFIEFYELNCYDNGHEWIDQLGLDDDEKLNILFFYDENIREMVVEPNLKGELRAVGAYFDENGMSIKYHECFPYFSPSAVFLDKAIDVKDSLSKDYVTFKKLQYNFFPIQSEGYLMASADELAQVIKTFDSDYQAYRDLEDFEEAKYLADYLFEIYVLPNPYFSEDYNYQGGYILDSYLKSYETYIKENPKSTYTPILINIIKLLKANANVYSKALDQYLIELGYSPNSEPFKQRFVQMESFSNITDGKERILLNPEASDLVTVSNMEELLSSIGSNKTIYLKPGFYQIPYELDVANEHVQIDVGTLKIKDVKNLTILSESGVVDLIADTSLEVLIMDGCENIQMDGIRLGHLRGECVGDVLSIKASKNLEINKVILFGCGFNGLSLENVTGLSLSNSLISDCQALGLAFKDVNNIVIQNTQFYRNGRQLFDFKNALNITLRQIVASDNDKEYYEGFDALMCVDEQSNVKIINSILDTQFVKNLVEGPGIVIQEE